MSKELQKRARNLLESGRVAVVIGHAPGRNQQSAVPVLVREASEAGKLVLTPLCRANLAVYLTRPEIRKLGPIAIVAREEDIKAVFVLMQEKQIDPENVVIIGFSISQPDDPDAACTLLPEMSHDELLAYLKTHRLQSEPDVYEDVAAIEAMSAAERWRYWQQQFSKCSRCYACRQACPLCYCEQCIVEKNQPQWIETSPHARGNFAWHLTRAFHLAGRCVNCGACEKACPEKIPLGTLNRMLAKEVADNFGTVSGCSRDGDAVFASFRPDDPDDCFD